MHTRRSRLPGPKVLIALAASPMVAIFLSANLVNVGNLAFNVILSRWLGPSDFGQLATLLTLFLAVMAVLSAVQLAVSEKIAAARGQMWPEALARLARRALVAGGLAVPVLGLLVVVTGIGSAIGLDDPSLLVILLCALPLALPLAIARGVAMGRLDARAVILSAQIEVWVRLIGALVAWRAGFGLGGIIAALTISVLAGWLPLWRLTFPRGTGALTAPRIGQALCLAALPFAALQAGQVVLLDADILIAQLRLGSVEAGYVAAFALFQRIQFFACFSLSSVLLPGVASAVSAGSSPARAALPVFALYAAVTLPLLAGTILAPQALLTMLVGPAFVPAAPLLPAVSAGAASFTLSYLIATYLAAKGDRAGLWLVAAWAPLQLGVLAGTAHDLTALVSVKLAAQLALLSLLSLRALRFRKVTFVPSQPVNP